MPLEIERKFRLPDDRAITDLTTDLLLDEPRSFSLRAVYFDSPDLVLARRGITLRRRTGGGDEGWHLKLPKSSNPDARTEVHSPILEGASEVLVPAELRAAIADVIGYKPLIPVADMATERTERDILTPDRSPLATLCEDHVTVVRQGQTTAWRELEVEMTGGGALDLERITAALSAQGAQVQPPVPKLVQALGEALTTTPDPDHVASAAEVITSYLEAQVGMIQGRESEVKVDAPESVHKMRVGTRRLRSTLRTFREVLDADRTEPLRAEVRWLAEMLGGPRDAEVLKARLTTAIEQLPEEAIVGPVVERITTELNQRHDEALASLVEALETDRHRALMESLVQLLVEPAFTADASGPATEVLPALLGKSTKRVTRMWKAAEAASGEEQIELAHEARKKAKASRYAWEAAADVFPAGKEAVATWEEVTEVLGIAQDTVVARERLHELAEIAQSHGEPTFTYGVLWQRELQVQDEAHDVAAKAIKRGRRATRDDVQV